MSKEKTNMKDLLHTQLNVEENGNNSNYNLITHEQLNNTPFVITGSEEQGYFIRFANYRLTQNYNTYNELTEAIEENKWNIISNLIITIIEIRDAMKQKEFTNNIK